MRKNWDSYFMDIVYEVAKMGTCDRGRTGVILVKENRIISTGYVGSPPGLPHCDEEGHQMRSIQHEDSRISNHCVRTTHAEQSAIAIAASETLKGTTLYSLVEPCHTCSKLIATAGIKRIVCENLYFDALTREIYQGSGIKLEQHLQPTKQRLRPAVDEYLMNITRKVAQRSTCDIQRNGVVIARGKIIVSTGYVGAPPGLPHCDEAGHQEKQILDGSDSRRLCGRITHAEQNAITFAAREKLKGSTLYCKLEPCYDCAKMIVTAGIERVVCEKRYHAGQDTRILFQDTGVRLDVLHDEVEQYKNQ